VASASPPGVVPAPVTAADVTVAVCTRDRPGPLRRALASVAAQSARPAAVLVVDNAASTDATRELVRREFPSFRHVSEPRPGLDFARNRALAEAPTEIVAFLDDDVVVDPDWVAATAAVFAEDARVAICTGRVEALGLETEGQRLFEANGGFARGERRIRLSRGAPGWPLIARSIGVGSGCSLAVRRRSIIELGAFDEALDLGPPLPGGGDLDILWRSLAAGHDVVYAPEVRARHEHRRDVAAAVQQILDHNRALVAFLAKTTLESRGRARAEVALFLAWRLAKPWLRVVRSLAGRDPLPPAAAVRLALACWRGLSAYGATRRLAAAIAARPEGSGSDR